MQEIHLPPDKTLRAVTVREPFATLIAQGFKPIENKLKPWPSTLPLPCTIAVHAGADDSEIGSLLDEMIALDNRIGEAFDSPDAEGGVKGKTYFYGQTIVGLVDVVASVDISDCMDDEAEIARRLAKWPVDPDGPTPDVGREEWANGPHCWVLANPRRFKTGVMCRGQLNVWRVKPEVQAMVLEAAKNLQPDVQKLPTVPIGGVPKVLGRPMGRGAAD